MVVLSVLAAVVRTGASAFGAVRIKAPSFTSRLLVKSRFSTQPSNGPGSSMAIQPAGALAIEPAIGVGSVPALRNEIAGEVGSGLVCTAVVSVSGAPRSVTAMTPANSAAARRLRRLVFIGKSGHGFGGFERRPRRPWIAKQRSHFFRRKNLPGAQWDSLELKRADLITPQPFDLVAQRQEKLANLALLAVVHVHVEIGGGCGRSGVDQGGAFHA